MVTNRITLKVYTTATSTTEVQNSGIQFAQDINYTKGNPGGESLTLTFFIPRKVTESWSVLLGQRIAVYNALSMTWEGFIISITPSMSEGAQGMNVEAVGAWAYYLMSRKTRKPWADTRLDNNAWVEATAALDANDISLLKSCQIDRTNRIRFTPTSIRDAAAAEKGWANGNYVWVAYTAPTGQTIKRITLDYDLQEGAQAWQLSVYNNTAATDILTRTTSNATPGTRVSWDSGTLATPTQTMTILFISKAAQTPASDGTIYGDVANVVVYTEVGSINAQEIVKDIPGLVTELSADLTKIGAITTSLVPFINEPPRTYADAITNAVSYGDTSYGRWGVWVGLSGASKANDGSSDGKPRLVLEAEKDITVGYDYAIRINEPNVVPPLEFKQNLNDVYNWIAAQYQDVDGRALYVTPDDDSALKDTASITAYGQREQWLTLPTTSLALAKNYARRYLGYHKDPKWIGSITVKGYIRYKATQADTTNKEMAASEIWPNLRLCVENWLFAPNSSATNLTFLVTGTNYNDADQTCTLELGKPDPLEFAVARMQRVLDQQRLTNGG
jgi:hypothetical protein